MGGGGGGGGGAVGVPPSRAEIETCAEETKVKNLVSLLIKMKSRNQEIGAARTQSALVCLPLVIALICRLLKSSEGHFACFLGEFPKTRCECLSSGSRCCR